MDVYQKYMSLLTLYLQFKTNIGRERERFILIVVNLQVCCVHFLHTKYRVYAASNERQLGVRAYFEGNRCTLSTFHLQQNIAPQLRFKLHTFEVSSTSWHPLLSYLFRDVL
jgi:hypothetical protein